MNNESCPCTQRVGVIRKEEPKCPHECVLPLIEVDTANGFKNLCACYVRVRSTNTTYYIDERSRAIIVAQGPVEYDDYDYASNPLGLRSQEVWDFKNKRIIRYNKVGSYIVTQGE